MYFENKKYKKALLAQASMLPPLQMRTKENPCPA
jgi:hypothetical protein